jgi:DeoR/GlpR family transcriptional regulator of sugar metabolism
MTDADPLEAEVKRAMIAQSGVSVLLVDDAKLAIRGLSVIASASEVTSVVASGLSPEQAAGLRASGASVEVLDPRGDVDAPQGDDVA